jgi:hypothetical protein
MRTLDEVDGMVAAGVRLAAAHSGDEAARRRRQQQSERKQERRGWALSRFRRRL